MNASSLAGMLQGSRRIGDGRYEAYCPIHEANGKSHKPSLSISDGNTGVVFHCHAGCSQDALVEAMRGLGWESGTTDGINWSATNSTADAPAPEKFKIVATYTYEDESGNVLYQIKRYDPKDFRQCYPDETRTLIWKKHPRQILYNLPNVLKSKYAILVEGEKDADCLRSHDLVGTTIAGGSKAPWQAEFTKALAGKHVALIPDGDNPGKEHVLKAARALVGNAGRIVVWEIPDPDCKDISDWFAKGHTADELLDALSSAPEFKDRAAVEELAQRWFPKAAPKVESIDRAPVTEEPKPEPANAKAAIRQFERLDEQSYRMAIPEMGISFHLDRARRERGELVGELSVACNLPGARTFDGLLSSADFNVSSASARGTRAKQLDTQACTKGQIDWTTLLAACGKSNSGALEIKR